MIKIMSEKLEKPKRKLLEKASQQALSETLGYDEARAYHLLLIKKEQGLEEEFSYSKKYRLMKNLFELGAVGKIKPEGKDFFAYILLPPTFLYKEKVDIEIIEYLENLYLENFKEIFNQNFSQFILKDKEILLVFLLKYFIRKQTKLIGGGINRDFWSEGSDKVTIIKNNREIRKTNIIDENFLFEFTKIFNGRDYEYIGYVSRNNNCNRIKENFNFKTVSNLTR